MEPVKNEPDYGKRAHFPKGTYIPSLKAVREICIPALIRNQAFDILFLCDGHGCDRSTSLMTESPLLRVTSYLVALGEGK